MLGCRLTANTKGRERVNLLYGDEGIWLPNRLPTERIEERYGFAPTEEWAEHTRLASVLVKDMASASFVSRTGLVVTNQHVAHRTLHDLSTPEKDFARDGFYAETRADEVPAKGVEFMVLVEIEDVTERVQSALRAAGSTLDEQKRVRQALIAEIEKESTESTGLFSQVAVLYQGGAYHLYRYQRYTDIRLVFAPEENIAAFGGDIANYTYPRYCLDSAFFRVYEDGKPLKTPYFFRWAQETPSEGDVVIASGHPGRTNRLSTVANVQQLRDCFLPLTLDIWKRREIALLQYAGLSLENKARAMTNIRGVQNMRKRTQGQLDALRDPAVMDMIINHEVNLLVAIGKDPELKATCSDAFDMIEEAEAAYREIAVDLNLLESGLAFATRLYPMAQQLLRLPVEDAKPNGMRLPDFTDANRESLRHKLLADVPIHEDLEVHLLADSLGLLIDTYGYNDQLVRDVLNVEGPRARAEQLIRGTALADAKFREQLFNGGADALVESEDPMIKLASVVDERARAAWERFQTEVVTVRETAYAKIANAMFSVYGDAVYPDATLTLRFSFGCIKGYEKDGEAVSPFTTIGDVFDVSDMHGREADWKLPESWVANEETLRESTTAFNIASTLDTHGGNSGSPVITLEHEIVGLHFDRNVEGIRNTYLYTDNPARAVAVSAAGILEVLREVYEANRLVQELTEA